MTFLPDRSACSDNAIMSGETGGKSVSFSLYEQQRLPEQLNYAMSKRQLSFREAAAEMCMSHAVLHRISHGRPPTVEHFLQVKRWLNPDVQAWLSGKPSNDGEGAECIRNALRHIDRAQARYKTGSVEHQLLGELSAELCRTNLFPPVSQP